MDRTLPRSFWTACLLLAACALTACAGDDTTAPGEVGSFEPRAFSVALERAADDNPGASDGRDDRTPVTMVDASAGEWSLTTARVLLRDIELDLPLGVRCTDLDASALVGATCDVDDDGAHHDAGDDDPTPSSGDKLRIAGPFDVDLVAGTATPSLAGVRVPDLAYPRVDLRIEDDGGTGLLAEHGWYSMAAGVDADGLPISLELALRFNEDIRIEAPGGVRPDPTQPLLVGFDASMWLAGLPVAGCLAEGELRADDHGIVRVDEDSACGDVENTLKDNLKDSGRLR